MSIKKRCGVFGVLVLLSGSGRPYAQSADANQLARVKSLKCVFEAYATGTWKN